MIKIGEYFAVGAFEMLKLCDKTGYYLYIKFTSKFFFIFQ